MPFSNYSFTCRHAWLACLLLGLLLSGCTAATQRIHPQFPQYRHTMGKLLVLQPDIGIYEKMTDGSRLYHHANSNRARRLVQQVIVNQLQNRHFSVLAVTPDEMEAADVRDVTALFRSVNRSIQLHTIGPQVFPELNRTLLESMEPDAIKKIDAKFGDTIKHGFRYQEK